MVYPIMFLVFLAVVFLKSSHALSANRPNDQSRSNYPVVSRASQDSMVLDRRTFFINTLAGSFTGISAGVAFVSSPERADARYVLGDKNSVVGREIASFNDLIYNFKNTALDGGLDAKTLKEPSVPFIEFGDRMRRGEVAFVEFMAPSGEAAYVTFYPNKKDKNPKPIRIGQGYPTGGKDSWASPDYVIRSVSNFDVPYKFTVPALADAKYRKQ